MHDPSDHPGMPSAHDYYTQVDAVLTVALSQGLETWRQSGLMLQILLTKPMMIHTNPDPGLLLLNHTTCCEHRNCVVSVRDHTLDSAAASSWPEHTYHIHAWSLPVKSLLFICCTFMAQLPLSTTYNVHKINFHFTDKRGSYPIIIPTTAHI